jgi:hypothetical protein
MLGMDQLSWNRKSWDGRVVVEVGRTRVLGALGGALVDWW